MISLSNILVGVDLSHADRLVSEELSEHCEDAVQRAIRLAAASGGRVTFMAVLDISEQAMHLIQMKKTPDITPVEEDAVRVLEGLVARAAEAGVSADYVLAFGSSWERILRQVVLGKHTLLIIGRRTSSKLSQFFFGRTAIKLLRKCPIPMLVARQDPPREVESILVADDFSDTAEQVLDAGVQLAKLCNTRLHVVHVIESTNDNKLLGSGFSPEEVDQLHATAREKATATLNERLSRTDYRTLTQGTMVHIEVGIPETVIAEKLTKHEIDLFLMGTAGRSGFSAMMMGNTAERLLSSVQSSLLAIKPEGFVCPVKFTE